MFRSVPHGDRIIVFSQGDDGDDELDDAAARRRPDVECEADSGLKAMTPSRFQHGDRAELIDQEQELDDEFDDWPLSRTGEDEEFRPAMGKAPHRA